MVIGLLKPTIAPIASTVMSASVIMTVKVLYEYECECGL